MHVRTACAAITDADPKTNAARAVEKIRADFAGFSASLLVFYSAMNYDPETLAAGMRDAFPGVKTIGCTTAGEMIDGRLLHASVVAMAFSTDSFNRCEIALIRQNGPPEPENSIFDSVSEAMNYLARPNIPINLNYQSNVGFVLTDRISDFSSRVLERLGELTDVIFVGGVAGDDAKFVEEERVFFDGRSVRDASVLALLAPCQGFEILKTQAAELTNKPKLVVTNTDADGIAMEFNDKPAIQVYAESIGVELDALDPSHFDKNPLALAVDGEPFLQMLFQRMPNDGARIFGGARNGKAYAIAQTTDIVDTTAKDMAEKRAHGPISALLGINCFSRHNSLKMSNQTEAFGALFQNIPGIAFSSYGEVYVGFIAMTSTMILFK
ncbi:MAG: hypothetical protein FWG74_00820 [Planctomycetes bacterium]|nr:hypothetical protein [Planctomycetota bacterium]